MRTESFNREETVVPSPATVSATSSCTRLTRSFLVTVLAGEVYRVEHGFGTGVPFGMRRITQRSIRIRPAFWS